MLAKEFPIEADVVIPVPETAIPVAIGYSKQSGIPMEMGIIKNRYIHRTFIQPEQHIRDQGVKLKLTPLPEVIKGKRVVVVDDSIVRGTTSKQIVQMVFEAGATEVNFVVSSPPVRFPDFYGIDTPNQEHLIAARKTPEEIREFLGATRLQYLSYEGLVSAIGLPEDMLCTSCFTRQIPDRPQGARSGGQGAHDQQALLGHGRAFDTRPEEDVSERDRSLERRVAPDPEGDFFALLGPNGAERRPSSASWRGS